MTLGNLLGTGVHHFLLCLIGQMDHMAKPDSEDRGMYSSYRKEDPTNHLPMGRRVVYSCWEVQSK